VPAVLGAVYLPVEEIVPPVADQVTAVLVEPLTVALNCAVPLVVVVTLVGATLTLAVPGAVMVTVAIAVLLESAMLVAITLAVPAEAGAVYTPLLDTVPAPLATLQLTAVLLVPLTAAVNCTVLLVVSVVLVGATPTLTVSALFVEPVPAGPPQPEWMSVKVTRSTTFRAFHNSFINQPRDHRLTPQPAWLGSYGVGITAATWLEYPLSIPVLSNWVTT